MELSRQQARPQQQRRWARCRMSTSATAALAALPSIPILLLVQNPPARHSRASSRVKRRSLHCLRCSRGSASPPPPPLVPLLPGVSPLLLAGCGALQETLAASSRPLRWLRLHGGRSASARPGASTHVRHSTHAAAATGRRRSRPAPRMPPRCRQPAAIAVACRPTQAGRCRVKRQEAVAAAAGGGGGSSSGGSCRGNHPFLAPACFRSA